MLLSGLIHWQYNFLVLSKMADAIPYNSFGQILSWGGEIPLGLAIARGVPAERVTRLWQKRFEPIDNENRDMLWKYAQAAVNAGWSISDDGSTLTSAWDTAPINQFYAGEFRDGGRGLLVIDASPNGGENFFTQYIVLPDEPDWQYIIDRSLDMFGNMASDSPKALERINSSISDTPTIVGLFMERWY